MTRDDLDALGAQLMTADDADDARRLAAIAWQLYSEAGISLGENERLHGALRAVHARAGRRSDPTTPGHPAEPAEAAVASRYSCRTSWPR
jgi:hypothetical protein